MKKLMILMLATIVCWLSSCSLITVQSPFADVDRIGTIIEPGESVIIQNTNGLVEIKYSTPTKRRIVWQEESREISLLKSRQINGLYHPNAGFDRPINDIHGVEYQESTTVFHAKSEMIEYLDYHLSHGFEYRERSNLLLMSDIGESLGFGWRPWRTKYLKVMIIKLVMESGE